MAEPIIRFEGVSKSFGEQVVLRDLSLDVAPGEFLTIIGRSGCGKTTALRLVNGLLSPDAGRVLVQGKDVAQTDPVALRRGIGYAIQSVGLFPHLTVEKNIAYVPSISGLEGWKGKERREKAEALLRRVGLEPALFLMDEPFGAVDEITRGQLQDELLCLHQASGITVLFVTHDIGEALKLGTRTLVLEAGEVQQYAPPSEILSGPATPFVEELVCRSRQFQARA